MTTAFSLRVEDDTETGRSWNAGVLEQNLDKP
jgi:hypothetical protein